MIRSDLDDGDQTLVPGILKTGTTNTKMSTLTEELNTMVINSDETDDEATMKSERSSVIIPYLFPKNTFGAV